VLAVGFLAIIGSPSIRGAGELLAFGERDLFGCKSLYEKVSEVTKDEDMMINRESRRETEAYVAMSLSTI
jgi:hypothetical protein